MGGKSKSKSKQESVTGPSTQQTIASNLLLEAIRPGSTGLGGYLTTGDTVSPDVVSELQNPRAVGQVAAPITNKSIRNSMGSIKSVTAKRIDHLPYS